MSGKHLSKGSTVPPLQKGKLRLYSMRFCPFAQRVHLVLDAKKIPYETVYVNLTEKPEWLFEKSRYGKVPAIELDGETLYESLIIAEFLDEKYPQRPLHSKDPWKKAKDRIVIEQFSKVIGALYRIHYYGVQDLGGDHVQDFFSHLDVFERELVSRGQPYFGGEKPGMVDYMIWPWCERADVLKTLAGEKVVLPRERFLRLMEWREAMKDDEGVKASYLEPTIHAKFYQSRKAGIPDYELVTSK